LDTPPLKLLDAVKHSVEDKRFFLSEQLLNVGCREEFYDLSTTSSTPVVYLMWGFKTAS
jgi:hypothetical protein